MNGPLALAGMAALGAYQLVPAGTGAAVDALVQPFLAFVDARIAQQNPNVFLWVALAGVGDGATGFACLAAFLACLFAENWHRVERERSDLLAALPQPALKTA